MRVILNIIWYSFIGFLFRQFPIKDSRIIVENFYGSPMAESPKYIIDEILKRSNNYEIIILIKRKYKNNNEYQRNKNVKYIYRYSFKELYYLSTAKIWIDNCRKPYGIVKRTEQVYIQTWHGGIALKKIEHDTIECLSKDYIRAMNSDTNMTDYMISNSKFCSEMFRRAFKYKGKIVEIGTPKNDILVNYNSNDILLKRKLFNDKIDINFKFLLYAPTFRDNDNYSKDIYNINFTKIIEQLEHQTGSEWRIGIKLHPNIPDNLITFSESHKIINFQRYTDIQELILASDLIITDYSSIMFDGLIANKIVILYCRDLEDYIKTRGLYFNFNDLPFEYAENENELYNILCDEGMIEYEKRYKTFKNKIGLCETGKSCEEIFYLIESL